MEEPARSAPLADVTNPIQASEADGLGGSRMIAPKTMPYASEGRRARGHCDDEAGEGALEAHGAECDGDGGVGRFEGSGDRRPTERPTKKSKRAPVEEPPKPLTKELPEAVPYASVLMEWKDYAENELKQLHVFRKQGLLDWPLVKGAINCAVVSCPVPALRAEIRALRDNGVYGSSMVPYLQVLRSIFDTTEDHVDDVEVEPEEFSESDSDDSDDSEDESSSEEDESEEEEEDEAPVAEAAARRETPRAAVAPAPEAKPRKGGSGGKPKGASRGGERGPGEGPSEYQVKMRQRYNAFTRFLGGYFASERKEDASVAELLSHQDAAQFGDDEVVSFIDMMTRENKIMLDEGRVYII